MAETSTPNVGARIAAVPSTDHIALHSMAMNSLHRCQHELMRQVPSYPTARAHLEAAKAAIVDLEAAESLTTH